MPRDKDEDYMLIRDVSDFILKETGVRVCRATINNWTLGRSFDYQGKPLMLKTIKRIGKKYTNKRWIRAYLKDRG